MKSINACKRGAFHNYVKFQWQKLNYWEHLPPVTGLISMSPSRKSSKRRLKESSMK